MFKKFGDSVQAHAKELADKVEAQAKETKAKYDELDLKKLSLQSLEGRASMIRESIAYGFNPNHRHDDPDEEANDALRTSTAKSHRFESFAAESSSNDVKWYIQGHDYFYALYTILEAAEESIFITDWYLSPEVFLKRPPTKHEESRLDRLLLKKAQQGIKIFIIVYKEVSASMTMNSSHTKHHLEDLHENIAVVRHPDHSGGEITLLWSHHEKIVVVDNVTACIGGLDLCFGRYDTHSSPLADVHPTDFSRTLFPGADFNNARVEDFVAVDKWVGNQQSRLEISRMAWQDVHFMLAGPAVLDVAQHFIERWNFVRGLKYKHQDRYPMLSFPHVIGETDNPIQSIVKHPHLHMFSEFGKKFLLHSVPPAEGGRIPHGGLGPKGNMKVQVVRSSSDWSHGILTEHSIQNAYIQLIEESNHCIYIENQFFLSNTTPGKGPLRNLIAKAIVERILSAARAGRKYKVVIVIPAVPGFAGDLKGNSGTLAIMAATYNTICRGGHSIMEIIKREGFNPDDYITVYNLRSFDRINNDPVRLQRMATNSGVDFNDAQAALARVFLGRDVIPEELKKNSTVVFTLGTEGGELKNLSTNDKSKPRTVEKVLPQSYDEAWAIIKKFESGAAMDENISDSVSHHAFKSTPGSLLEEAWSGSEESERLAYVTEELYIHTKLMIVDDRIAICGSANLNDRSQVGDHDSEIAIVVEDQDEFETTMDGKPYMATRFASSLRKQLWKQHLGLIDAQHCPASGDEFITDAMKPVGTVQSEVGDSEEDKLVEDPLSSAVESLMRTTGANNAQIFNDVFHCVPSADVRSWSEYKNFVPAYPVKPGHVASMTMPVQYIKENLSRVKGHLVTMPLNFLEKEDLQAMDGAVNPITLSIYL